MSSSEHHLITRGYVRLWCVGEYFALIDKASGQVRCVPTRGQFKRKHFNSYRHVGVWNDSLEKEWAEREAWALSHIHRLHRGERSYQDRAAVKVLAAVHFARSESVNMMSDQIIESQLEEAPQKLRDDPGLRDALFGELGREPTQGEREARIAHIASELYAERRVQINGMVNAFNKTMTMLEPHHVQLVWPRNSDVSFVFGDTPLAHEGHGKVAAHGGVALGDAKTVFFPLGPKLGALFTSKFLPDGAIYKDEVIRLNRLSWNAALRQLGAHPRSNWRRSLDTWSLSPGRLKDCGADLANARRR